jgi:hypothetical protein
MKRQLIDTPMFFWVNVIFINFTVNQQCQPNIDVKTPTIYNNCPQKQVQETKRVQPEWQLRCGQIFTRPTCCNDCNYHIEGQAY